MDNNTSNMLAWIGVLAIISFVASTFFPNQQPKSRHSTNALRVPDRYIAVSNVYVTNIFTTNLHSITTGYSRSLGEEWTLLWANWTNKPVGVVRVVNGRLEQIDVKHDREKPY